MNKAQQILEMLERGGYVLVPKEEHEDIIALINDVLLEK